MSGGVLEQIWNPAGPFGAASSRSTLLTPRLAGENAIFPLAEYFHSPKHNFTVCAIPKCACRVVKQWFLAVQEPGVQVHVDDVHMACRDRHGLHLADPAKAAEILHSSFTFTFVRDPHKRIASAFIEKFIVPENNALFEPVREVMEENERLHGATAVHDRVDQIVLCGRVVQVPACSAIAYQRGLTFREFVRYLCVSPDDHLDAHWRPQSAFIAGRRMDFIGRMESLSAVLPGLACRLGAPAPELAPHTPTADRTDAADTTFPGCHADMLSRELHRRGVLPSAMTLFDDELRALVSERYAAEVRLHASAKTSV